MGLTYDQDAFTAQAVVDANSFGGLSGNPNVPHNDQYDAYRHAILAAELMQAGPDAISKYILDNHENFPLNPTAEKNMDRWNNDVGAREYYRWKEAVDTGQTTDSLRKWIYDRVVEGVTINDININDSRVYKDPAVPSIPATVNTPYNDSKKVLPPRRDPLTLDLDGDGLETTGVAATNPILFDHDSDGIKNGTGWVNADDGFLVRDVNGNGSIDNGRELFGDSTIKSNGQAAVDGFDALADLDSNADGVVNASDTQFNNLRIWRDLNQDGISQTDELFTLSSQNITGINVAKTINSQTLANGSGRVAVQQRGTHRRTPCGCNQIADLGTFTRTDGTTGTAGAVTGNLADINLAEDTFNRTFPNVLDTTSIATLPDMQGSGAVRDLREAATQSTTLQSLLTQFAATTTRDGQRSQLDSILSAWADTSGYAQSYADRLTGLTYTLDDLGGPRQVPYAVSYEAIGNITNATYTTTVINTSGGGGGTLSIAAELTPQYQALIAEWNKKIHILEAFNGAYFFGLPTQPNTGAGTTAKLTTAANDEEWRVMA